jgi:glycosyltransferase involved in cell wall biosynthesis
MTTFTIITSTLNALPLLKSTAHSVAGQTFDAWQWIVIDGASRDGTPAWLQDFSTTCANMTFISEPDQGIYDAWNKALPLVRGDWVLFLGAGDQLADPKVLETSAVLLAPMPEGKPLAYGRVQLIDHPEDSSGEICDQQWGGVAGKWGHGRPVTPHHQGIYHRASLFREGKKFDTTYRIAGDTAFILAELLAHGGYALDVTVARMLKGGVSGKPQARLLMLREILRVNRACGLAWYKVHYQYAAFLYHAVVTVCLLVLLHVRRYLQPGHIE